MIDPARIQREIELEQQARVIAEERLQANEKRSGLEETVGGKKLIGRVLDEYVERLDAWMDSEGAKRRKSSAYQYLTVLSTRQLALIVSRVVLHHLVKSPVYVDQLVAELAERVLQSVSGELYRLKDTEKFDRFTKRMDWQARTFVRKRMAEEEFKNECIELEVSNQDSAALGVVLLELFVSSTELFTIQLTSKSRGDTLRLLYITDKGSEWLKEARDLNIDAEPFNLPMVVPPYEWTTLDDGGYYLQDIHPASLVRTRGTQIKPLLEAADLKPVYDAVNAIQATPWRINQRVYEVWLQCVGTGQAGCSQDADYPIPDAVEEDDERYAETQGKRRDAFEAIAKNNAVRATEAQKRRLGEILREEPEFYYPHNVDFRGRIYPLAGVGSINPQGDDSGKGLLEFAEGKVLGEDGLQWLYIHTQNVWGNDKVSLQERIDATEANFQTYIQYAYNPLGNRGWMEADKPFCFLACCFELRDMDMARKIQLTPPEEFVSRIPIALDGTCSGLQHFAALMLDEDLATAVNVKSVFDKPADIYGEVAAIVDEHLLYEINKAQAYPLPEPSEALYWGGKVNRDLIKQPVMCLAYGVTASGMRSQIREKCKKLARKGKTEYLEGSRGQHPKYLAECIHDAIGEVSTAAFDVMDWLSDLAKARCEAYPDSLLGSMGWTAPSGLPILQEYYEYDSERINVFVDGRRLRYTRRVGHGAVVKKNKQIQSTAPNYIHSMDAAHLMLTVNACVEHGVDSFAMIHDSFGTHAADAGTLFEVLRDEFVKMYETDWLRELYEEQPECVDIQPPPSRRTLELSDVMMSDYFFS